MQRGTVSAIEASVPTAKTLLKAWEIDMCYIFYSSLRLLSVVKSLRHSCARIDMLHLSGRGINQLKIDLQQRGL